MNEKLERFYLKKEEPQKSCFLALREIILDTNPQISEKVKYGMPCFMLLKKNICYLWKDKNTEEPYILFVDGGKLEHPDLETGDRKRMKILRVNPNEDLPQNTIRLILNQAINLTNFNCNSILYI